MKRSLRFFTLLCAVCFLSPCLHGMFGSFLSCCSTKNKKHVGVYDLPLRGEDTALIEEYYNSNIVENNLPSLYVVSDGHGGKGVSTYLKKTFSKKFHHYYSSRMERIRKGRYKSPLEIFNVQIQAMHSALEKTIATLEEEILDTKKFDEEGSTLIAVVHDENTNSWFFANVGDSRAALINKRVRFITREHDPFKSMEDANQVFSNGGEFYLKRYSPLNPLLKLSSSDVIEIIRRKVPTNGYVKHPRGKKYLQPCRTLGDKGAKPAGSKVITAIPDITRQLVYRGDIVVIASDGVWSYMTEEEVRDLVLKNKNKSEKKIAKTICKKAKEKMILSKYGRQVDDITAIVIKR